MILITYFKSGFRGLTMFRGEFPVRINRLHVEEFLNTFL